MPGQLTKRESHFTESSTAYIEELVTAQVTTPCVSSTVELIGKNVPKSSSNRYTDRVSLSSTNVLLYLIVTVPWSIPSPNPIS